MPITAVKILPAIGIARLGNSPDHFIGPEIPGERTPPPGGYRDPHCRIRRQAARFRLFAYDGATLVGEVTMADAAITWTVHLANKKASWKGFNGPSETEPLRNADVPAGERWKLEIDPGPASLDGPNQAAGFNTGHFLGKVVPLGEMRTDAEGRLLVLGGFGSSGSVPPVGWPITHYANNDHWHDDVSDGPVTASVTIDGSTFEAAPAWVICPPPDFAPPLDSITTLYDVLFDVAVQKLGLTIPAKPSFTNDVLPILQRVFDMVRVTQFPAFNHLDFSGADAAAMSASRREEVFGRLRKPKSLPGPAGGNMPLLRGDNYSADLTVTASQYLILQKWTGVEGTDWENDWTGIPPPPGAITPDGLTRAALEACVGGAFYPGIEAGWFVRDKFAYSEPFRLDAAALSPGDVTKQMAVPWQADFYDCQLDAGIPWWPAQRPDDVFPESGGGPVKWIRDLIVPGSGHEHEDMVANWHKLGFIVKKGGQFVEVDRRPVCTSLFFVNDRSHFSQDEVASALDQGSPAAFEDSFYVIAEGFVPSDLGVTKKDPTPEELEPIAPVIDLRRADDSPVPQMSASARQLLLEDDTLPPGLRQRLTFIYRVEFTGTDAFDVESQPVKVLATKGSFSTEGSLTLFKQPNPFMTDGPTSWLSTDVRVFKAVEGEEPFGAPVGAIGNDAAAALGFIDAVVKHFNSLGSLNHPFDNLAADQQASQLELSEKVGTKRVFNFAVARVRYRGKVLEAHDVCVFFRLFTTAATGLDYDPSSTYRRTPSPVKPIARLGLQGGKVVTIPCFGRARKDTTVDPMDKQTDDLNVHTFPATGSGEAHHYFGCWLDFNQTTPRFPQKPVPTEGPWPLADQKSIQDLVRGLHQCLVAEIYFDKDPIGLGASPASSDNLAQRNLAIVLSDNPGSLATHTVQHTFEIKATHPAPQLLTATITNIPGTAKVLPVKPDELMIRWRNLPRSTRLTLYMPDVDADEVLRLAGQSYSSVRLERVDDHTLRCLPGDVSYIPLPPGRSRDIAGLLTLELPAELRRGQVFQAVVQQISGQPRAVLGAFQLTIPVSHKAALLEPEIRALSVLRHIALSLAQDDPWHQVFVRWLDQIAERVRGFGGDPDKVAPSPDGSGRLPDREPWWKGWLRWKKDWKREWKEEWKKK